MNILAKVDTLVSMIGSEIVHSIWSWLICIMIESVQINSRQFVIIIISKTENKGAE